MGFNAFILNIKLHVLPSILLCGSFLNSNIYWGFKVELCTINHGLLLTSIIHNINVWHSGGILYQPKGQYICSNIKRKTFPGLTFYKYVYRDLYRGTLSHMRIWFIIFFLFGGVGDVLTCYCYLSFCIIVRFECVCFPYLVLVTRLLSISCRTFG